MKNTKSTIPLKLREDLNKDPEYQYCCVTGQVGTSDDPIEWHHNLKFAGSNVQRRFCILPILRSIHLKADTREVRERLNWIMWNRATIEEINEFSKAVNVRHELARLNSIFGIYRPAVKKVPHAHTTTKPGEKPWWYKVPTELQPRILKASAFHKEHEGIVYAPLALITLAINEHCDEVDRLMEEDSLVPKSGTVY